MKDKKSVVSGQKIIEFLKESGMFIPRHCKGVELKLVVGEAARVRFDCYVELNEDKNDFTSNK